MDMITAIANPEQVNQAGATRQLRRIRSAKNETRVDMKEKAAANDNWIALIEKVRDDQDRAAFAALFQHFAPRVKAFLMKSGAGESMADECTQDVMATLWTKAHLFDPSRASASVSYTHLTLPTIYSV